MGSTTPLVRGAYQQSANVDHSNIMFVPVTKAIPSVTASPMGRNMRSTGSLNGRPPTKIGPLPSKWGWYDRHKDRKHPYRMINVAAKNTAKTNHCRLMVFRNTSA